MIGKVNNSKVSERKKTKKPKQDSHNRLRSPMSEAGEQENQRTETG